MSNIITIMPDDWTAFPLEETCNALGVDVNSLKLASQQGYFTSVSESMTNAGLIPEGKSMVTDIVVINNDLELYMQFA